MIYLFIFNSKSPKWTSVINTNFFLPICGYELLEFSYTVLIWCEFECIGIQSIISTHHKHICTHTTESHKGKHVVKDQKEISKREVAILFYSSILYYVWRKLSVHPAQANTYSQKKSWKRARFSIRRYRQATLRDWFLGRYMMAFSFMRPSSSMKWSGTYNGKYVLNTWHEPIILYILWWFIRRHLRLFAENASGRVSDFTPLLVGTHHILNKHFFRAHNQ